jgi:hypothetical protein
LAGDFTCGIHQTGGHFRAADIDANEVPSP